MKMEHKGRKHREAGGVNEAEEDVKDKPEARTNAKNIDSEAEERKKGGRAKRRAGGEVRKHKVDHEGKLMKRPARKDGGKTEHKEVEMHGEAAKHHAGHKPRKAGGRTGSDEHPFSSARAGEQPKGHKAEAGYE